MTMVAHLVDAVIGVDTHRDTHDFVLLAPNRTELLHQQIPNSDDGFRQLLQLVREHSPGPHLMAGLEGTRSYGVGLNRHLTSAGTASSRSNSPSSHGDAASARPTTSTQPSPPSSSSGPISRHCQAPAPTGSAKPCRSCSAHGQR